MGGARRSRFYEEAERFQFTLVAPEAPVKPRPSATLRPKDGFKGRCIAAKPIRLGDKKPGQKPPELPTVATGVCAQVQNAPGDNRGKHKIRANFTPARVEDAPRPGLAHEPADQFLSVRLAMAKNGGVEGKAAVVLESVEAEPWHRQEPSSVSQPARRLGIRFVRID